MDSYNFLPDNEVTEVEGRKYLNPNLVVDETNTFIDRLRNTQQANMQQIATQTQRLGTDVPSNLGGLTGAGSYWSSRYVTPQTKSAVSNLRAAAQAQALNQALANEQERWKKRYQDAYNAYQKRAWNKNYGSGGDREEGEDPNFVSTSSTVEVEPLTGKAGYASIVDASGQIIDVPLGSTGGEVRDADRYWGPSSAGYVLLGTPWMGEGTPGQHVYNSPSGETIYVNLEDGYKIMYDSKDGKLVQVKE